MCVWEGETRRAFPGHKRGQEGGYFISFSSHFRALSCRLQFMLEVLEIQNVIARFLILQ